MREIGNTMPELSEMSETLRKAMQGLNMFEEYVDDEISRSEQDIKGDYIQQMRENPKLKRSLRTR
jgi:hypothetical protein